MNRLNFDLNLLRAFDVLTRERSVTRAAEELNLTQPAMSNVLRRLRSSFDFRSVYASMIQEWMGVQDVGSVLGGDFAQLSLIA